VHWHDSRVTLFALARLLSRAVCSGYLSLWSLVVITGPARLNRARSWKKVLAGFISQILSKKAKIETKFHTRNYGQR
jgi:hypothetical protein